MVVTAKLLMTMGLLSAIRMVTTKLTIETRRKELS